MLITQVELENIKSYHQLKVDFRRGATAISGPNGAGKTTILEAIGFALFDYLPYNQGQFVREGEKYGRVVVHLIGSDDRPYQVERRCGSGSRWFVYDCEADSRVEQGADVLDNLHDLFGIDRERSLSALFRDALGVPQGSFTAIFQETPAKRKQTFDTLLQIEDYKTAADYLLDAQKEYKEQAIVQQGEIQRLQIETRELDNWREQLKKARELDQQKKEQNARCAQMLLEFQERAKVLKLREDELSEARQYYEHSRLIHDNEQKLLTTSEQHLSMAREAQQAVMANREAHQRYLQAEEMLKQLRQDEQKRNTLRQRQADLNRKLSAIQANIENWQVRLAEVAAAHQRIAELLPLYEQQMELEKQRDDLGRKATRYDALVVEYKRIKQQQGRYQQQREELQQRIREIEPLEPVAALLAERNERLVQLRVQQSERNGKRRQLQEKRDQLREKQVERDQAAANLRKAENNVAIIEEHRPEAEEMPHLQQQFEQLQARQHRLEGNISGYVRSRTQSAGGQCPLLQEPCLNIRRHGIASLESYFDSLLSEEHEQLSAICQQKDTLSERMGQIKKYADALNRLGQYIEKRDAHADHLQRVAIEITRLERDVDTLTQELEALKHIDQQIVQAEAAYNESKQADGHVRELGGLHKQWQQLQEQLEQCAADMRDRRQQGEELQSSREQLAEVEQALQALNDPRSHLHAQQEVVKQKESFHRQLLAEQQKQDEGGQQLATIEQLLSKYIRLDEQIGVQEATSQQCRAGHQTYLQNERVAALLPEREKSYALSLRKTEEALQTFHVAQEAYQQAEAAFDRQEMEEVNRKVNELHSEISELAESIRRLQHDMSELEQNITHAEALLVELGTAQKEKQTLEELQAMMEQFRKLIKEAAPHVLKAMLADISAEANRIFGEIMGDRSAQLSWQNDYEIILRRQGVNRTFAQLSGGEQMSAALAVRLALLKKLSTLNLAFFDEPTQNMDELRRMNLAEQIRRVRGFDQLIVISHDDTFEQGLDSLIRLHKVNGETRLVSEEETIEERERVHAS
ncbi:MAG TPA: SMC family ATPase [Ktedonobacteraceae bacterium]|nr:SMC family ATPase [Ktedonobacteraceae bacterium]